MIPRVITLIRATLFQVVISKIIVRFIEDVSRSTTHAQTLFCVNNAVSQRSRYVTLLIRQTFWWRVANSCREFESTVSELRRKSQSDGIASHPYNTKVWISVGSNGAEISPWCSNRLWGPLGFVSNGNRGISSGHETDRVWNWALQCSTEIKEHVEA